MRHDRIAVGPPSNRLGVVVQGRMAELTLFGHGPHGLHGRTSVRLMVEWGFPKMGVPLKHPF